MNLKLAAKNEKKLMHNIIFKFFFCHLWKNKYGFEKKGVKTCQE